MLVLENSQTQNLTLAISCSVISSFYLINCQFVQSKRRKICDRNFLEKFRNIYIRISHFKCGYPHLSQIIFEKLSTRKLQEICKFLALNIWLKILNATFFPLPVKHEFYTKKCWKVRFWNWRRKAKDGKQKRI